MTPTAKEFITVFDRESGFELSEYELKVYSKRVVEFAKLHVEAALKAAAEKVTMELTYPHPYEDSNEQGLTYANADEISRGGEYGSVEVEKYSILNAYPLENIK